jgi:RNA polymerase sigma-70 factor (ECF subfamily)
MAGDLSTSVGRELAVQVGLNGPTNPSMTEDTTHQHGNPHRRPAIPDHGRAMECGRGGTGSPIVEQAASSAEQRQEAFARYVLPEIEVLLRVARSLTPRPADVEDLVQDTLVRAFGGIDGFDGTHPRAWLLTIMRNAQINRTRRRRPELLYDQDAAFDRLAAAEGPGTETPEGVVVGETFDAVVADALTALPDRFRQVVVLVDVERLTYMEAAKAMGLPVGTVMSRLHRARARIRQRLVAADLVSRRRP